MKDGSRIKIVDLETGRQWDVEVIRPRRNHRTEFGESLREHCDGAIQEAESRISGATHCDVRYAGNPAEV